MTTISSSPSISPKPFSVPSQRSIWGAASSSSPGGGTSPFSRQLQRQSPTISAKTANRDVLSTSSARLHTSSTLSSAAVTSASSAIGTQSSTTANIARIQSEKEPIPADINQSAHEYRDYGTQYTPPGLPPTASAHNKFGATEIALSHPASDPKQHHKRAIETETSISSEDVLMSGTPLAENFGSAPASQNLSDTKDTAQPLPTFASHTSNEVIARSGNARRAVKRPDSNASDSTSASSAMSFVASLPSPSKKSKLNPPNAKILPRDYMRCEIRDLGEIIADMLEELIRSNDKIPPKEGHLTRFHSRAPPSISVTDYLHRLIVHATLSPPLLLALVYYIDRLCALYPAFTITSLTVHRFLITAATVAAKGLSDSFWTNHTYARVGGVSTKELAMLELDFLERLNWAIVPKPEMLEDYYSSLVSRADGYVLEEAGSSDES